MIIFHYQAVNFAITNLSLIIVIFIGSPRYISAPGSFMFSLSNRDNLSPFKSGIYKNSHKAIYRHTNLGPTFGWGHDFFIASNARSSSRSRANFGGTYHPPSGYSYRNSRTQALLAGSLYFSPDEVEVYYQRT